MTKRIGFACKYSEVDLKNQVVSIPALNTGSTTVAWLDRQTQAVAEEKLWDLMKGNIEATRMLVQRVANLDTQLKMVRLGSDMLPVYTHPKWCYFWKQPDVIKYCEKNLARVGEIARANDVRLSMHPGQFVVLASETPEIVNRSIEEFEYHADMARWMGYGRQFQDFKINVHISGRAGPAGIKAALQRLTPEARNCITIENDEISWGIDASLELANDLALVLDIHHHNIHTGEYIEATDDRVKRIIDSWRGVRPVIHYSASREDVLVGHSRLHRPALFSLMEQGYKKGKLRAHSEFMWNTALNTWAFDHWSWADVMVECKSKNIGAHELFRFWKQLEEQ